MSIRDDFNGHYPIQRDLVVWNEEACVVVAGDGLTFKFANETRIFSVRTSCKGSGLVVSGEGDGHLLTLKRHGFPGERIWSLT